MTESQASAAQAAALNVAAQTLNQRGQALERAARQSLVLGDAQLRQSFDDMAADARRLVQQLEDAGLPPEQARQWRSHMDTVHELLRAPPACRWSTNAAWPMNLWRWTTCTRPSARRCRNSTRARAANSTPWCRPAAKPSRTSCWAPSCWPWCWHCLWAWAGGRSRLERAIRRLGENQLERPVAITGPAGVRRVGQQLEWLRLRLLELDADKARFCAMCRTNSKPRLAALREGVALLQDGVTRELTEARKEVAQSCTRTRWCCKARSKRCCVSTRRRLKPASCSGAKPNSSACWKTWWKASACSGRPASCGWR